MASRHNENGRTIGMGRLGAMAAAAAAIAMQSKKAETVFWGTGSVVIGSVNGNVGGDFLCSKRHQNG